MRRSDLGVLVAVGLLTLISFGLGATYVEAQSMWRDEVDAIRFAQAPLREILANFSRPGWNGPLYFALLRGWIEAAGSSPYAVRLFSLIWGVLGIPLVYALGRRLIGRQTGLVAAALAASAPYVAWYALEAKMYTWVTALAVLAIYALRRAHGSGEWFWWTLQILATSLAAYSHIVAALLIPVQVLLYAAWRPRTRRQWIGILASVGLLLLPYLPLLSWQGPLLLQRRETGFARMRVGDMLAVLVTGWSIGPYPPRAWLRALPKVYVGMAVWGALLTALLPLIRPGRTAKRRARAAISLALWATLPVLLLGVISLWQPIFTDRYLIWCTPAFYLLAALGLSSIRRLGALGRLVTTPAVLLLVAVNLLSSQAQLSGTQKADFRAAAVFVAQHGAMASKESLALSSAYPFRSYLPYVASSSSVAPQQGDLILFLIPHARHAFSYYYDGRDMDYAEGPFTNHRGPGGAFLVSEVELGEHMERVTEGYDALWLIASEVDSWDERHMTEAWLADTFRLRFIAHFAHIDVHRYARASAR